MTMTELQRLYREHQLSEAIVEPFSLERGWIVEFRDQSGDVFLLTDDMGEERHYENAEHASQAAMKVGFTQVRVESQKF